MRLSPRAALAALGVLCVGFLATSLTAWRFVFLVAVFALPVVAVPAGFDRRYVVVPRWARWVLGVIAVIVVVSLVGHFLPGSSEEGRGVSFALNDSLALVALLTMTLFIVYCSWWTLLRLARSSAFPWMSNAFAFAAAFWFLAWVAGVGVSFSQGPSVPDDLATWTYFVATQLAVIVLPAACVGALYGARELDGWIKRKWINPAWNDQGMDLRLIRIVLVAVAVAVFVPVAAVMMAERPNALRVGAVMFPLAIVASGAIVGRWGEQPPVRTILWSFGAICLSTLLALGFVLLAMLLPSRPPTDGLPPRLSLTEAFGGWIGAGILLHVWCFLLAAASALLAMPPPEARANNEEASVSAHLDISTPMVPHSDRPYR